MKRPQSGCDRQFGLASRNRSAKSNLTPGPGKYNISGNIGKNNKKGLIKPRSRPVTANYGKCPGPWSYHPKLPRKGQN